MPSHCVHGQTFIVHKDNQAFITLFFCVSRVEAYDAGLPLKTQLEAMETIVVVFAVRQFISVFL